MFTGRNTKSKSKQLQQMSSWSELQVWKRKLSHKMGYHTGFRVRKDIGFCSLFKEGKAISNSCRR